MSPDLHAGMFDDPDITMEPPRLCAVCGLDAQPDDLVCPRCGGIFELSRDTVTLGDSMEDRASKSWPMGQPMGEVGQSIVFEIDGQTLPIPAADGLMVGRAGKKDDLKPDIDLDPYQARERGVSRFHMALRRRGKLIFISDAGSTNGTWLNGHRLIPHASRLVRDGDEVQLGQLKLIIRFA